MYPDILYFVLVIYFILLIYYELYKKIEKTKKELPYEKYDILIKKWQINMN